MGYLIGKEKAAATFFYYLFLLPGVILHEFSAYMMAGVFNVRSTRFTLFPEAQEDGSLEMGFVQLEEVKNPVYAALIGVAPLLTGMGMVVLISNSILGLPAFFASLKSSDINVIGQAFQVLVNKPDFFLWTYLLFAVSNAMMPNAEDRRGWWIVGAAGGGLLLFMTIIGLHTIVVNWLSGPISSALYSLTAVFGTVLLLDCVAAIVIWIVERLLERVTGHKVDYAPALSAGRAVASLPAPKQLATVYDLHLPLPAQPGKIAAPVPRKVERPALGEGAPKPAALPSAAGQPEGARPGLPAGPGKPAVIPPNAPAKTTGETGKVAASGTGTARPFGTSEKKTTGEVPKAPAAQTGGKPGEPAKTSPFGSPSKPAEPAKSSPFGGQKPAEPAKQSPFGSPAKPGAEPAKPSPFGSPSRPAEPAKTSSFGGQKPAEPAKPSPFGSPAKPGAEPAKPSPFGSPSKPGGEPAKASPVGAPKSGEPAKPSLFGKPGEPARTPAAQTGKGPISGPPALARPGGPPAAPGKPAPFGAKPGAKPNEPPRSRFPSSSKDDYIDADVIDEEDEDAEDDDEIRYVDDPDL